MRVIQAFTFTLIALAIALPRPSLADVHVVDPIEIDQKGTLQSLTLTMESRNVTTGSVYFITSGDNVTSATEVYVDGPNGLRFTVRTAQLGSKDAQAMLSGTKGWMKASLMTLAKPKGQESVTLSGATESENAKANAIFHLKKDACAGKNIRYISQLQFDLTGVDDAAWSRGIVLNFGALEYRYKGGRRASIKPSSDGMYKGEPIGLFETIAYGNEYVNIVTWKGGTISRQERTPIVKYVSYKGLSLSLARLKQFLNGGKSSFELTNGAAIYGVCFTRQRRRQSANGYPNP